ncbi:MAG: glycosyltransferase, partial [Trebonia sp.]
PLAASFAPPFVASRARILAEASPLTVAICTRDRPDCLRRCLASVLVQSHPRYTVVVVDNAPRDGRTGAVVRELAADGRVPVAYVVEPAPGLARARNRALDVADTDAIAWLDDDEVADPDWLAEIARGFETHPDVGAVAGVMVPGSLDTAAQIWFEQYGGHNKHRGFTPAIFSSVGGSGQNPLYPLPPFGTGGNMAFRRDALRRIGGFNPALGAGSWALSGEDTRAFTDLLRAGGSIAYQPTAITHHFHRRSKRQLRRQMYGVGAGLTAYYASMVLDDLGVLPQLRGLLPDAARDLFGAESLRSGHLPVDFPADLRWANRLGMLSGPWRYLAAWLRFQAGPRHAAGGGAPGSGP